MLEWATSERVSDTQPNAQLFRSKDWGPGGEIMIQHVQEVFTPLYSKMLYKMVQDFLDTPYREVWSVDL